jgi:REP-associated tyrosine transposase
MPYWQLYYHFIWGTKNSLPLIDSALEPDLYRALAAKTQDMGGFVHSIGGMEDQIHLAVSVPPKIAPAKFIGDVKGNSSHTSITSSNPISSSTGRMNTAWYLLVRETLPQWYDIFIIRNNTIRKEH